MRGSGTGPGGKRYFLMFLTRNNHTRAKISPDKITVAKKSIMVFTLRLLDSSLVDRCLFYTPFVFILNRELH